MPGIMLREGQVFRARADSSGEEISLSDFQKWGADPRRIHIVGLFVRRGVIAFSDALESRLFPSDTIAESALAVHAIIWKDIPWQIHSVPPKALDSVRAIAAEFGLVVRNTVPIIVRGPGGGALASISIHKDAPEWEWFPLKLPNIYTLESDDGTRPTSPGSGPKGGWG